MSKQSYLSLIALLLLAFFQETLSKGENGIEYQSQSTQTLAVSGLPSPKAPDKETNSSNSIIDTNTTNQPSSLETSLAETKLARGEVLTESKDFGEVKYVTAKILIDQPLDQVWPILANPFEFERKICPRLQHVNVLVDHIEKSLLECTIGLIFPIPDIKYIVESKYTSSSSAARVDFKRVGGMLKDFQGFWQARSKEEAKKTEVTYSVSVDPGFPIPHWLLRQAVKHELSRTLYSLRNRVMQTNSHKQPLTKSILAASNLSVLPALDH